MICMDEVQIRSGRLLGLGFNEEENHPRNGECLKKGQSQNITLTLTRKKRDIIFI